MARIFAGVAAGLLFLTGFVLFARGSAETSAAALPAAPPASAMAAPGALSDPPEATPKSREQKRFARADKDDDGRITMAELTQPRRKAFAKLDKDGNGQLSFDEWAVKTLDKFGGADDDRSGWLSAAEYAATAPKPSKKKARCACG